MVDLNKYPKIKEAQEGQSSVIVNDLVAISNCDNINGDIDSTVVADNTTHIVINGTYSGFINRFAVVGREIVRIINTEVLSTTTKVYVEREKYGTVNTGDLEANFKFRTVTLFDVCSFEVNGNSGNTSELFSFQVETGKVEIDVDNIEDFSPYNSSAKYRLKEKTSAIYIFKGFNGQRVLNYAGFFDKAYESYGRGERRLSINFYDKTGTFYSNTIYDSFTFENIKPKELITTILKMPSNMAYYTSGLDDNDFYLIKAVYSKEYPTYSELFNAIALHGIRICYDELERIKIFSDLQATSVVADLTIPINETNITEIKRTTDSRFIRNKFTSTFKKRQPLYDYTNDLQGRAKLFRNSVAVSNFTFLLGNDEYAELTVSDSTLMSKTQIGDFVLLVDNLTGLEFYGKVLDKEAPNTTKMLVGQFSKVSYLTSSGYYNYLNGLGFNLPRNFTLHFNIAQLPEVANITINFASGERGAKLNYALLPQITGEDEEVKDWEISFGSAEDLSIGKYAGITTNIEGIYGTWNNSNLLYDREKAQFDGVKPPIYLLTNRITSPKGNLGTSIVSYDTFDNSNVELVVAKSEDSDSDITTTFKNTITINSSQVVNVQPLERTTNINLKVPNLTGYNVGDVIMVQPLVGTMGVIDQDTYNTVKNIRYVITACITEGIDYYIQLSDNYPIATEVGVVFPFKKYPYNSIVFLQEMFIRGNPVIEEEIPINIVNQASINRYGEIAYTFDAKFYDENGYRDLLDYLHKGFGAMSSDGLDRKYVYPIKVRDHWHVQKGDIIKFQDRIYTGVETSTLWYVLSVSHKSKDSQTTLNVININNFNADGSWIKLGSKLQYKNVGEVFYEYNESDTGKKTIAENDDVFGQISATKIDRSIFSADLMSYADGKLTFGNFVGTDKDNKKALLFSVGNKQEFIVMLNNEYLYVNTYSEDSVVIIKRGMFSSKEENLAQPVTVTFYYITSVVNQEGTLVSQDLYVGNDSNYIKFDSDTGEVDISTQGTINISNESNRLYFDKEPNPSLNKSQILLGVDWKDDLTGEVKANLEDIDFQVGEIFEFESTGYIKFDSYNGDIDFSSSSINVSNNLNKGSLGSPLSLPIVTIGIYSIEIENITTSVDGTLSVKLGGSSSSPNLLHLKKETVRKKTITVSVNNLPANLIIENLDGWVGSYNTPIIREITDINPFLKVKNSDDMDSLEMRNYKFSEFQPALISIGNNSNKYNTFSGGVNSIGDNNIKEFSYKCSNIQVLGYDNLNFNSNILFSDNICIGKNNTNKNPTTLTYYSGNIILGKNNINSDYLDYVSENVFIGSYIASKSEYITKNVAIGERALSFSDSINSNTAIGHFSMQYFGDLTNSSALGFNATVTGSNQVQLGNSSTTTYVYGTVQNRSDIRDKTEIVDDDLGLNFINKLRPVKYKWDMREDYLTEDMKGDLGLVEKDGSKVRNRYHSGFIAQEVKQVIDEIGVDFGGYQDHSVSGGKDVLSLGYDEFIAPMVKAIQELSQRVVELENIIKENGK